jgi:hypothetical protein
MLLLCFAPYLPCWIPPLFGLGGEIFILPLPHMSGHPQHPFSIRSKRARCLRRILFFRLTGVSNVRPAFAPVALAALFERRPRKAKARFPFERAVA